MKFNKNIFKNLEILLLIMIGFSPLISQINKAILTIFLLVFNFRYTIKFFINLKKNKINTTILIFLLLFFINIVINIKQANFYTKGWELNIFIPLSFFLGRVMAYKYSINEYLYRIEKIVYILVLFSLIGMLITYLFPYLIKKMPSYNFYHTTHKTMYIYNFLITEGTPLKRNSGIAWEPGAFQFLMNLSLFSYITLKNKVNYLKIVFYSFAIFLTFSTVAFPLLGMNILLVLIKARKKMKIVIIIVSVIILFFILPILDTVIVKKLLTKGPGILVRLEPFIKTIQGSGISIFGIGNNYFNVLNIGSHDSYAQIMARYGVIFLGFILYRISKLRKLNFVLPLIILFSFANEVIWLYPFVTTFYFFDYKFNKNYI